MREAQSLLKDGKINEAKSTLLPLLKRDEKALAPLVLMGAIELQERNFIAAEGFFERALSISPDNPGIISNLGVIQQETRRLDKAEKTFLRAIELNPNIAQVHSNLGLVYESKKEFDQASLCYGKAAQLNPNDGNAKLRHVHLRRFLCDWSDNGQQRDNLFSFLRSGGLQRTQTAISPFPLLAMSDDPEIQLKVARHYSAATTGAIRPVISPAQKRRDGCKDDPHRKLKIAYVSADYRQHPVAAHVAELLRAHDRKNYEIHAVSLGHPVPDSPMRQRITQVVDQFHECSALSDRDAAQKIFSLGIDIAVDLTGHTTEARSTVLAARPAPVQVQYLGYAGTLGAKYVDYVLADRFVVPESEEENYSEAVVCLPDCFFPSDSQADVAEDAPTRADCDLPEDAFVFTCLNRNYKISLEVFEIWMRLLTRVENSVLWLSESHPASRTFLREAAQRLGVDAQRLVFTKSESFDRHLARLPNADLFLDTFPYNAHATAVDALRMGLPIVTMAGRSFASRVCGSLLRTVGVPEMVTTSTKDYETKVFNLATHPDQLKSIQASIVERCKSGPLFDSRRLSHNIESAYRTMWSRHCDGHEPTSFEVPTG